MKVASSFLGNDPTLRSPSLQLNRTRSPNTVACVKSVSAINNQYLNSDHAVGFFGRDSERTLDDELQNVMSEVNGRARTHKYVADLASILEARDRIAPYAQTTAVVTSSTLDALTGCHLFFKCELLQKGGSFKFRGACNAVLSLSDKEARRGVVTHSSGNHAAALSLAARIRGISAHVVVPRNIPTCKLDNIERYGGHLTLCDASEAARKYVAAQVLEQTGGIFIPTSNDLQIISVRVTLKGNFPHTSRISKLPSAFSEWVAFAGTSGQGTIAVELLEQVPHLDAIVMPISGGGLCAGVALAAKAIKPSIRIIAAEPCGADDAARSKASGRIVLSVNPKTVADGLVGSLGDLTWPVIRDLVDEIITVKDEEIIEAMRLCYQVLKLVVEPSAVLGLAVTLSDKFVSSSLKDKNVGVILSGGNVDLSSLWT